MNKNYDKVITKVLSKKNITFAEFIYVMKQKNFQPRLLLEDDVMTISFTPIKDVIEFCYKLGMDIDNNKFNGADFSGTYKEEETAVIFTFESIEAKL